MRKAWIAAVVVALLLVGGIGTAVVLRMGRPSLDEFQTFAQRFAEQTNMKLISTDVKRSDSVSHPYVCEGVFKEGPYSGAIGTETILFDKQNGQWKIVSVSRARPDQTIPETIDPSQYASQLGYAQK